MVISLCIATYKRPDRLGLLMEDIVNQQLLPNEVIVVDNDIEESAKPLIEEWLTRSLPFKIIYEVQPIKNIALTRNKTVSLASCEWLAFIDDDERAPSDWLQKLAAAAHTYKADGVLAPVIPQVPDDAQAWIKRGSFYDFPRLSTGTTVPLNRMRFGNVLLRGDTLRSEPGPFDPNYGLMTGEDADMLARLANKGAHIIWCDEAIVLEPVEAKRLSLNWLLQRAISGGQEFARKSFRGTYGEMSRIGRLLFALRSFIQLTISVSLMVASFPFGSHHSAKWLIRAAANFGKISAFCGWKYQEYA
jgi:succinoglycan biosynthesis protein ExoM